MFSLESFQPLIDAAVQRAIIACQRDAAAIGNRLALKEPEAAELLSLTPTQLRAERRRGRIGASVGPAGVILYCREDLLDYLASRRWKPK